MKKALLLAATAFTLSSCYMFWNTGERLKESAVTYTGMDMAQPVGDVVYKSGGKFYIQVPEVTYKTKHKPCGFTTILGGRFSDDRDVTRITGYAPTGRTRWYEVDGSIWEEDGKFHYLHTVTKPGVRPVTGCPAGAKRIPSGDTRRNGHIHHDEIIQTDTTRSKQAWLHNAGAVPLTYVVDPVLMVGSTVVANAVAIPSAAAIAVGFTIIAPFTPQQWQPDAPAKPQEYQ